ncbi:hypothetical protein SAMN02746041_01097 [Desulfacinum hydrothermale DSM 13146]|uniref:Uncharacterized protein n=1 Tax=Desulfacinum hydrothermale DSM 13146 TaxID=1121390 RepID=A0A1W1XBH4_9BACT|nr:hypothetical protein [Desulfacinum hydrothermale]SMC21028.1 hypothetical protein SAMN02746041_01097 [Desulfacinum hydrothermale DSM 13146]
MPGRKGWRFDPAERDTDHYREGGSMATVMPQGEAIRKAVKWVSECLQEKPDAPLSALVNEAVRRFDLSPKEAEFLLQFYAKKGSASDPAGA